jgi:hypothetical protein
MVNCCVWGVLTPVVLVILVLTLPSMDIGNTEGGTWMVTVATLLRSRRANAGRAAERLSLEDEARRPQWAESKK